MLEFLDSDGLQLDIMAQLCDDETVVLRATIEENADALAADGRICDDHATFLPRRRRRQSERGRMMRGVLWHEGGHCGQLIVLMIPVSGVPLERRSAYSTRTRADVCSLRALPHVQCYARGCAPRPAWQGGTPQAARLSPSRTSSMVKSERGIILKVCLMSVSNRQGRTRVV